MKKSSLILLMVLAVFAMQAQVVTKSTAKKKALTLYTEADNAFVFGKFDEAEKGFKEAIEAEPNFINAHFQLAELNYLYKKNYSASAKYYKTVVELDKTFRHDAFFKLGLCYFNLEEYENSKAMMEEFISKSNVNAEMRIRAKQYISNVDFAKEARKNPMKVEIKNIGPGVNTKESEYFPALTADEKFIYYTVSSIDSRHTQEDIYVSENVNGQWQNRKKLSSNINTNFGNEGAHCISPDGFYLLFTACNWPEGVGGCDLYVSKRKGNVWQKPINMGININSKAKDTQPSISADSRAIYYISTRSGGYGGGDIYVTYLEENGKFGKPRNLGPKINTPLNEERPFIHPDGKTLFFASEGHPGMGDFDVYMSRMDDEGNWGAPVNLGYPINTKNDERGVYISTDGRTAYYAAMKDNSIGQIDIYSFEIPEEIKPLPVTYVKGAVHDRETGKPLTAIVELTDLSNGMLVSSAWSDAVNGEFLVTIPAGKNYAYSVNKEGYLFYSENFSLKDHNPEKPYLIDIRLDRIKAGNRVILKNIFFNTGEYVLQEESFSEINKIFRLLQNNPSMKIEIGGHTDNVGNEKDNQVLSENRAKAVYDALIEKGIVAERLSYFGYGMSQPIADNDSAENRQLNRRTEFKVIQ